MSIEGIKVFSATLARDREALGEQVTKWLIENQHAIEIVDTVVTQSSDHEYHCLSITLFYTGKAHEPMPRESQPAPRRLNFKEPRR